MGVAEGENMLGDLVFTMMTRESEGSRELSMKGQSEYHIEP